MCPWCKADQRTTDRRTLITSARRRRWWNLPPNSQSANKPNIQGLRGLIWEAIDLVYQSPIHYDTRKYNFTNRIISIWNGLPDTVISTTTVDTFKARLDRFWQNKEVIYNWKTYIHIGSRSLFVLVLDFANSELNLEVKDLRSELTLLLLLLLLLLINVKKLP